MPRLLTALVFTLCLLPTGLMAQAPKPLEISEPTKLDLAYMERQMDLLEELGRNNFGRGLSGDKDRDLALMQRLLDQSLVRASQTAELQAMGMVMGNHLAEEFDLHWVIYEDHLGRSRALRYRDSDAYVFPMTLVSRRVEGGNRVELQKLYDKAAQNVVELRPKLPFQ